METIEIRMPDGVAEGYVTRPSGSSERPADDRDGPDHQEHPGVLVFMDAIGLRPRIAEMAQRIADWGYVVLAPNTFFRSGTAEGLAPTTDLTRPGAHGAFFDRVGPRLKALTTERAERDIPIYLEALRDLPGVGVGPVGVTGYCMGARLAVRAANLDQGVAAVGGFHGGRLATESDDSPHRGLGDARAEFVFGHADRDRSMGPQAVAELGRALAEAGLTASNEIYPGAAHGYTMSDTSSYDEAATERHFAELRALFGRTLGGTSATSVD